ncbi:unnamed protein product [Euphydryas editha]|uniref:Small RNA 2'-O-methyltransferase n=1 Tax=Euphydryas editha TaxID=104508 RepID=A0AAU9UQW3_EUPED|nr:unnamed protein product [Euphydryas editha]
MIITLQTLIFFRESLISVIDRLLRPYYKKLSWQFQINDNNEDDDSSDEHVFAEYDDEKGVVFFPPVYAQRYAAVVDCLMDERWSGKLEKVIDFGYHDMSFIKYLKDVPGIKHILGVDIESIPVRCSSDLLGCDNYVPKRESPLLVTLFQGNAADPDYRLIGCDAVIAIEMIEHMLPHDLERFVHTVFGFIKPRIVVLTTPNGDFNVLFKALEKNGLRRLDHFFEWSREQFHDWCSNIVSRYPQYTVISKGIGPGPPDTLHLGCCSQLALFVAKDYQKQPDLNLNSLALVAKAPSPNNLSDMTDSWESPDSISDNMLCLENNDESYTKLLINQQSYMTIVLTSPTFSLETLRYQDKTFQCNLDMELGKNFLMFDDEVYFNILIPSRKKLNRVYEIEDVASRLNCSTIQVKKFTKVTQGLLAKNKTDNFVHTREVVDEIQHLTKMLNFNRDKTNEEFQGNHIWYNINWGENAPYWNQYYKIVREYNYPFEIKSDECRILDLISEEINSLVDRVNPGDFSGDSHKIAIPLDQLMKTVEHITTDMDKVRELLEWNGYDIADDLVIYTRLVVDNISLDTQEDDWQENTLSDWDISDVHSTSISDGSTAGPDNYGRCLLRALDHKVRKLRTLLADDEDITTELNRIVCRLMKLALYTSKQRPDPPPANWMQLKLFDLLTLTEKAIERRRRHYFESYQMKPIEYFSGNENDNDKNIMNTLKKQDNTVKDIVSKYYDVLASSDFKTDKNQLQECDLNNTVSVRSEDLEEIDNNCNYINSTHDLTKANDLVTFHLENVYDINMIKQANDDMNKDIDRNSIELDPLVDDNDLKNDERKGNEKICNVINYFSKTYSPSVVNETTNSKLSICKVTETIIEPINETKQNEYRKRSTKINTVKKVSSKINGRYKIKRRKSKEHQKLQSTLSKPIPNSIIKLCNPDQQDENNLEKFYNSVNCDNNAKNMNQFIKAHHDISATEESLFIGIVTECGEEFVPLRRNIGIDPPVEFEIVDDEVLESVINMTKDDDFLCNRNKDVESITSETIFIYDINEPTTSKGIRNLSTDAQCGPDISLTCAAISATTSLSVIPNIFSNGIKIEDSEINTQITKKTSDFGTCTELINNATKTNTLHIATGIKIKDSDDDIFNLKCSTMTQATEEFPFISTYPKECASSDTKVLKSESSALKVGDSGSENRSCVFSLPKSPSQFSTPLKNMSDIHVQSSSKENLVARKSQISYVQRNLICGGVHVHSFKERLVSEDVVYQGEWQRMRPSRRKNPHTVIIKRSNSLQKKKKPNSMEKMNTVNALINLKVNKPKKLSIKPTMKRNEKSNEVLKKDNKGTTKTNIKIKKETKINKTIVKTTSIVTTSTINSKKPDPVYRKNRPIDYNYEHPKNKTKNCEKKNYIPMYLRRRKRRYNTDCDSKNETDPKIADFDKEKEELFYFIKENIIKELLKFTENAKIINDYIVCRNENEIKTSVSPKLPTSTAERIYNNNSPNRNQSPTSQNSSTCSSPNSIATVRAVCTRNATISHRKGMSSKSASIDKNNPSFEAENKSMKNKNNSKRYKCTKKSPKSIAMCNNKENIPESSKNIISYRKEISTKTAGPFLGKTKDVFMAQGTTDNSTLQLTSATLIKNDLKNLITAHDNLKASIIISSHNQACGLTDESMSDKTLKYNMDLVDSHRDCTDKDSTDSHIINNGSSILKSVEDERVSLASNKEDNPYVLESPNKSIHNTDSIMFAIRQLIEQKIHITETNSHDSIDSGSETIILNRDDIHNKSFNSSSSPLSISTIVDTEDISETDVENALVDLSESDNNVSVLNYTDRKPTLKEIDSLSLKSSDLLSVSTSKFSEYYLADNELDNTLNITSVQDIFERSDRNIINNIDGLLAAQAFSGFSINTASFVGDRLDNVNLIDSETGSIALSSARQAVSEELFVSGRSSDTYESCLVDDDISVPNWLFNAISQQPSIEESEAEDDFLPIPLGEPVFDLNGNAIEPGVGIGAGAGDGRGIHSDQSQDSSGRGTSLSSSASSGPSEAILIDLSSVAANQPHYVHEPMNIPEIIVTDLSHRNHEGNDINDVERARNANVQLTSDVDADISSLDTDAIDSDD